MNLTQIKAKAKKIYIVFIVVYIIRATLFHIKRIVNSKLLDIDYDNSVIFLLACDYNNVGDILIRKAQEKFISDHVKNKKIITIPYRETEMYLNDIAKKSTKKTIIVITGGGDTDDKYYDMDRIRNYIIRKLAKNKCKLIGFPQTISYSKTKIGNFCLRRTQKAYSKNRNFVLFTREKRSYYDARQMFPTTESYLVPDIVLSLDLSSPKDKRTGLGTLMRDDSEKTINNKEFADLKNRILLKYSSLVENDMTYKSFDYNKLDHYVKEKTKFVKERKVILTDRLHGMILCYITKTPCIVFKNYNHKIQSTYNDWLKGRQNYIILEDDFDNNQIMSDIEKLYTVKPLQMNKLNKYFLSLNIVLGNTYDKKE